MKNIEKKQKSGILKSALAVFLVAVTLFFAVSIASGFRYKQPEDVTEYLKFDYVHSYEARMAAVSSMRIITEHSGSDEHTFAVTGPDGTLIEESYDGAYGIISDTRSLVYVNKDGESLLRYKGVEYDTDFIKEHEAERRAYLQLKETIADEYSEKTVYIKPDHDQKTQFFLTAFGIYATAAVFIFAVILLITSFFAKGKAAAYEKLSEKVTGKLFFELKWAAFAAVSAGCYLTFIMLIYGNRTTAATDDIALLLALIVAAAFLWFAVFSLKVLYYDMKLMGVTGYFKKTLIVWLIQKLADVLYRQRPYRKLTLFTVFYVVNVFIILFVAVWSAANQNETVGVISFIFLIVMTAIHFALTLPLIRDLDLFSKKLVNISEGKEETQVKLSPRSDAYPLDLALDNVEQACRANAEKALAEEKTKVELITNVSHDLKTPLTSIISYTELLSQTEGLGDEANDYLQIITKKEQKLKKLIDDLFELSKASGQGIETELSKIDFAMLLKQQLSYYEDAINSSSLVFITDIPDESVLISADGIRLHNVIDNLINNALKYSMPGSRVYVDLCERGGKAYFEIKNISKDKLSSDVTRFTERFVRGDESRSEEGSGLGLAIAKTYTELCGGVFGISADGDLFKVTLTFDTVGTEE